MHIIILGELCLEVTAYLIVVFSDDDGGAPGVGLLIRCILLFLRLFEGGLQFCQRLLREFALADHLLRREVGVAQRDGDDELTALIEVVDGDGAVVHLDERTGEVEADACARIAVVGGTFGLIEALEDLLKFVFRYLLAVVADGDGGRRVVVGEADADLTAGRGVFEGVGEHVDNDLVEVRTVDPYGQFLAVVVVGERDLPHLRLVVEEGVDIIDESHEVALAHAHLHLTLVDLPEVHHLVDQAEDALGIAADGLIDTLALRVFLLLDEGEQRRDDERHRGTYLVTDVHEEAEFGLTHLLGMDMSLKAQAVLFAVMTVGEELPGEESDDEGVEEIGPCRTVPGTVYDKGEVALGRLDATALGLHTEAVGAWRQVGEGEFVASGRQRTEGFAVDAVVIDDMLRILIGECGELDGERIVVVAQFEVVAGVDGRFRHLPSAGACGGIDGFAVDGEGRQMDVRIPLALLDIFRFEPSDATRTAEEDRAVRCSTRGTVAELIALQTVVGEVVHLGSLLGIEEGKTVIGGNPEHTLTVALYRRDAVHGQTVGSGVGVRLLRLQVVAEESLTRAVPDVAVILTGHTDGHAVVQTVAVEGLRPAATGNVETAESHRRGGIEALTV